ncbi:type II toxin-antitoxin system VapC family toxin [Ramlibacter sp. WS9]|uniref:type II toxin-antitoxin system VapC family toxin n=1 Tax=Ramlibacter sp. WS9 TaxID=1882741 RepID=UPI0011412442|nr:type II toxin-antitoxin system VapC family toxin [Ramlibacter sp. WS9]ROZ78207.1 type II toxin-antitoxin system VapC family toxin [Ramlibacter sp. WS9]
MYLLDTDVVSELRKGARANRGAVAFLRDAQAARRAVYLSVITLGELRHGIEKVRHRGDASQSALLEKWLDRVTGEFEGQILPFGEEAAQVWGRLLVPHAQNIVDKQVAAIALVHGLTVVTRNTAHYKPTGAALENPFV